MNSNLIIPLSGKIIPLPEYKHYRLNSYDMLGCTFYVIEHKPSIAEIIKYKRIPIIQIWKWIKLYKWKRFDTVSYCSPQSAYNKLSKKLNISNN